MKASLTSQSSELYLLPAHFSSHCHGNLNTKFFQNTICNLRREEAVEVNPLLRHLYAHQRHVLSSPLTLNLLHAHDSSVVVHFFEKLAPDFEKYLAERNGRVTIGAVFGAEILVVKTGPVSKTWLLQ